MIPILIDDGVFIPCDSTSYIVPVSAGKAYSEIVEFDQLYKTKDDSFQIPYVVNLSKFKTISEIEPCFHFKHPNITQSMKSFENENISNERFRSFNFVVKHQDEVCHGFAGYFSSTLYNDIFQSWFF